MKVWYEVEFLHADKEWTAFPRWFQFLQEAVDRADQCELKCRIVKVTETREVVE